MSEKQVAEIVKIETGFFESNKCKFRRVAFRCTPPFMGQYPMIVASHINGAYATETYTFPCELNEQGEIVITDFGELEGSQRGTITGEALMRELGWKVVNSDQAV